MIAWLGYEKYLAFANLNYFDLYLNSYSLGSVPGAWTTSLALMRSYL